MHKLFNVLLQQHSEAKQKFQERASKVFLETLERNDQKNSNFPQTHDLESVKYENT